MKRLLAVAFAASLLLPVCSLAAAQKKTAPAKQPVVSCVIKGNINKKEKIYHLPGCASYKATIIDTASGERWFCSEKEAKDAGWRKAKNC